MLGSIQDRRKLLPSLNCFLAPGQLCLNKQTGKVRIFQCAAATFGRPRITFDDEAPFRRPGAAPANESMIPVMFSTRLFLPQRQLTAPEIDQITGVFSVDGDSYALAPCPLLILHSCCSRSSMTPPSPSRQISPLDT